METLASFMNASNVLVRHDGHGVAPKAHAPKNNRFST